MKNNITTINSIDSSLGEPFAPQTPANILKRKLNILDWQTDKYSGSAPSKKFLIEGIFPLSAVSILAATGGVGKGMLMLDLALNIANPNSTKCAFGANVPESGSVVVFFAEDDRDEIHRRLNSIDPNKIRDNFPDDCCLHLIPLPNAGGAFPIVESNKEGITESKAFQEIRNQLRGIKNLKLIGFDPLASFVRADINADPAVGAFLMNIFQEIATETEACVIVTHHMNKPSKDRGKTSEPTTIEELYHSLRGTSALGNGSRAVYVLGIAPQSIQDNVFRKMNKPALRNSVYIGGIGKANGPADWKQQIFLRSDTGLLENITDQINQSTPTQQEIEKLLLEAIASNEDTNAFTKTGLNGLFERKNELPDALKSFSKHTLSKLIEDLLSDRKIGQYHKNGTNKYRYLGIPGGPLSQGAVDDILYDPRLKQLLLDDLFEAEKNRQPFSKNGNAAPWKRKENLSPELKILNQAQLQKLTEDIFNEKLSVISIHGNEKSPRWIGSPNGDLATNPQSYEFAKGSGK